MKKPSLFAHLRDVLLLPFVVTVIVPYLVYDPEQRLIPDHMLLKCAGIIALLAGLTLLVTTVLLFARIGKGTLAPWQPTQKLVISGPYRHCRNPMISGVLLILISETLLLHSTNLLITSVLFFVINTLYFIYSEEPGLEERFGEDYRRYKRQVPRWVPKMSPYKED
ncbi:MAG TPA: isoprenylcysteine carboxylmethyltransferase family protein [Chitinophaga sp.]|uniref:methyltransferase family protein n=1 Tax=Chitinophaga sp. TaxID=1869181 RepID=UPI002C2E1969|nr:isoprenylcysteine carboxylmethyltransferase family protein [Chitinophaga sp.]HVI46031.1 isoprenylcysteine carboxylmethyltransferase family protein [Chitinophaga sp.]